MMRHLISNSYASNSVIEVNYIRHGEATLLDSDGKQNLISQISFDNMILTDMGESQAYNAGKEIIKRISENEKIILIYSPIKRTSQTAKIIRKEFKERSVIIDDLIIRKSIKTATGLDRFKNEFNMLTGNDLFDKWIKSSHSSNISYLESYQSVVNRFKLFLRYVLNFRIRYPNSRIRIVAVGHAELPDYIMVKFFKSYGLANGEILNIKIYENNKVLLSITGACDNSEVSGTLKDLFE